MFLLLDSRFFCTKNKTQHSLSCKSRCYSINFACIVTIYIYCLTNNFETHLLKIAHPHTFSLYQYNFGAIYFRYTPYTVRVHQSAHKKKTLSHSRPYTNNITFIFFISINRFYFLLEHFCCCCFDFYIQGQHPHFTYDFLNFF